MLKFGEIYVRHEENISYFEYFKLLFNEISINDKTTIIISFGDGNNYGINNIQDILKNKTIVFEVNKEQELPLPKQIEINNKIINYINPKYSKKKELTLNFNDMYISNVNYNISNVLGSRFNCMYKCENKNVFSIVKKKSNDLNPIYHFAWDSDLFDESDIVFLIYKILSV